MPSGYSNKTGLPVAKGRHWNLSDITKKKISVRLKNNLPKTIIKKGEHLSPNTEFKKGHKLNLGIKKPGITGVNHYNWKGGNPICKCGRMMSKRTAKICRKCFESNTRDESLKARCSIKYTLWRASVLKRDNYTCQMCFIIGGKLEVDHIKPFAYYPNLRFSLENGRTLCKECHKKTDTWGYGAMKHKNILIENKG